MKPAEAELPAVSRETAARLGRFVALLTQWNTQINLVARADLPDIRQRHLADSLQLLPLIPEGDGPMADLGTGGGFPGLVLAMALDRPMHLVESDRRKAAFLTTVAGELGLRHVTVLPQRLESVALPPIAVLTARALAPLAELLPQAHRLLAPDGVAIFPKGRQAEAELTQARLAWTMQVERLPSRTDPAATILRLTDIRRAGA